MITKEECLELLKKYEMPDNILAHSLMVNKIAVFLSDKLLEKGVEIYTPLVDTASLLHDIGRKAVLDKQADDHIEAGYETLQKENLISQAIIARKHGILSPLNPITKPKGWEEKVVFYADKRAGNDKIISSQERIADFKKRYPAEAREIEKASAFLFKIEKEIFDKIGMKPEELDKYLK